MAPALLSIGKESDKTLKITTERLPNCQVAMTIEPDDEMVQEALRKAAKKVAQRYTIPGFRKGKAPYAAVVRVYGKEALYEQVVEDIGDTVYKQALEESGLEPIAPGALEDVTFDPLVFKLTLPMPPEVDLGDYRAVRVERPVVEVTDEEVQEQLTRMQQEQSEWEPVEAGAAVMGDLVDLRLIGRIGEETIIDEEAFELVLEPKNEDFPPGFDSQFVNQDVGASLAFDLTYPDDWPSDRAGKTAHFLADIQSIKRRQAPDLDDNFAALIGDYDTLDALKDSIREGIATRRQDDADAQYTNQVIEKMLEVVKVEYPPELVEESLDRLVDEQKHSLERSGIPFADYLRIMRQSETQFRAQLKVPAERRLRADLLLARLPSVEGLTASEEEITDAAEKLLADAGENAASMRSILESPAARYTLANDILRQKAIDRLLQIAEGIAPELPAVAATEEADSVAVAPEIVDELEPAAAAGAESAAAATAEVAVEGASVS